MFSEIANTNNRTTKGPTLLELFTATGKLKKFFFARDVRCVHHGWHGTHRYDIKVLATHASWHRPFSHYIHSHRLAAKIWTTMKNNFLGNNFWAVFYLYRLRKYVSYGFPIIRFCIPGIDYETPCIRRLFIWMHEINTIKLHVQVFLRMNTWMFETCRRQYN
jgi:hypothetical protein